MPDQSELDVLLKTEQTFPPPEEFAAASEFNDPEIYARIKTALRVQLFDIDNTGKESYEQEKLHSAIKVSNAVDRSGQAVRRLTGDPARATCRTHAAPRSARAC